MKQHQARSRHFLVRVAGDIVLGELVNPKSLPGFKSWAAMISRCQTKNHKAYPRYGGAGIKVCERWKAFPNFYLDMGPRPTPTHSLDRIDTNGNYEPSNCRWATIDEQAANRRNTVFVEFGGKPIKLIDIVKGSKLSLVTVHARIRTGWALDAALTIPVHVKGAPQPHRKKHVRKKKT